MPNVVNPFVNFMRQYDISSADYTKIFDEYTDKIQYEIKSNINKTIIETMRTNPKSIIITGNAGDGKTRICRNVYEAITGETLEQWNEDGIEEIHTDSGVIRIIKDLSELQDSVIDRELLRLQDTIVDNKEFYLIAANEGKLTHALLKNNRLAQLYKIITQQFASGVINQESNLQVYNLLHTSSSIFALNIIQTWNDGSNWNICDSCSQKKKCIINRNHEMLSKRAVQKLINRIYRSLDATQTHMTMRELLIQLTYLHLGGLSCEDVHKARGAVLQAQSRKVYYENLFGHSTSAEFFEHIPGFAEIKKYDPGLLSNCKVDDFILNGDLSGEESAKEHDRLFGNEIDTEYGYFKKELNEYRSIYKNDDNLALELVTKWMPRLRRKYYFEMNLQLDKENEKNMVAYKYRSEFLNILKTGNVHPDIQKKLVTGLNQYFAKQVVYSPTYSLYVVNENLFVYRTIDLSNFLWNVESKYEQLDKASGNIYLEINKRELKINLLLFEYLMRLANGGLPHILGEDVEILLNNFKNLLIADAESIENTLQILKYDSQYDAYVIRSIIIADKCGKEDTDFDEFD